MPVPKGVPKGKYDRCVDKVNAAQQTVNPYAVCAASLKKKHRKKNGD